MTVADEDEGRTIFVSGSGAAREGTVKPDMVAPTGASDATPVAGRRLRPGDVLNHIFEVRRYITAGGMGEVWEGVNTHTDERVAIKVMLPQLAADPNVQAMFRKEARTLTRLSHPALVAYRVLAIEPSLNILYIVTEYVDGTNLQDVLGQVPQDPNSLKRFARRMAEGLRAAHALGAIHRDMSPDNILLEGGELDRARIIDFGIAKDLDPHKGTIVGDGFAGKLGYVAPEQLGDFGRDVGPWTDIYGLGLVVLAVAAGRAPAMGVTLVEAVDRRRAGVDISSAPPALRPVLSAMLAPDPALRLRSMDAVIEAIDRSGANDGMIAAAAQATSPWPAVKAEKPPRRPRMGARRGLWLGGGAAVALVLAGGAWFMSASEDSSRTRHVAVADRGTKRPGVARDSVASGRAAIARALSTIPCSWLDVQNVRADGDGMSLNLGGVAGNPVAAQGMLLRSVGTATRIRDVKADIMTLPGSMCGAIDTFAQVRAPGTNLLSIEKQRWEMDKRADGNAGDQKAARVAVYLDPRINAEDFTLVGWEDGAATPIGMTRDELLKNVFTATPDGRYMMKGGDIWGAGVKGFALIRGKGPFPTDLVAPKLPMPPDWPARFLATARARAWTVEMLWFQTQDLTPN